MLDVKKVDGVKQYIQNYGILETYKSIEAEQEKLRARLLPYDMIYGSELDRMTSPQKVCEILRKTQFAAQLRLENQAVDQSRDKLADLLARFDQRILESERRFQAEADAIDLERRLIGIAGKFNKHLGRSEWSEANQAWLEAAQKVDALLKNSESIKSLSADQWALIKEKSQTILSNMDKDRRRIQWPDASILLKTRYQNLSTQILDLWESNPSFETSAVLQTLFQDFNTKPGRDLPVPRPTNLEELAIEDAKAAAAEQILKTLVKGQP